jgi:cell division septal protein FtsQ
MKNVSGESEMYQHEALADAERRYLRRQKPVEVRRRGFSRRGWPAVRRWIVGVVATVSAIFVLYQGARFFLFSPAVQLAGYDQIEVVGNHYVSRAAVTERFASDIDLTERTPVAFLRTTAGLTLLDAQGVILERPLEAAFHFPVVTGLTEAMQLADREKRMHLFLDFLRDVDLARPGAGDSVSEVDLADAGDVRVTLAGLNALEPQDTLLVRFGDQDFVNKYRLLLDNLDQWHARTGRIESVDLRFARQVVVNPEQESVATRP